MSVIPVEAPDPYPARTPCHFDGCDLSVEEHHRLARGYAAEATALRAKMREPERVSLNDISDTDLLAELDRRLGAVRS